MQHRVVCRGDLKISNHELLDRCTAEFCEALGTYCWYMLNGLLASDIIDVRPFKAPVHVQMKEFLGLKYEDSVQCQLHTTKSVWFIWYISMMWNRFRKGLDSVCSRQVLLLWNKKVNGMLQATSSKRPWFMKMYFEADKAKECHISVQYFPGWSIGWGNCRRLRRKWIGIWRRMIFFDLWLMMILWPEASLRALL